MDEQSNPGAPGDPDALMGIGAFGRRVGLAASALRFYDDCGVLRPARVDPVTGYRYYSPDQEERAVRVRRSRAAGVPLADVLAVLDGPPEDARTVLEDHARRAAEAADAARAAVRDLLVELPGPTTTARVGGAEFSRALRQVVTATASGAVRAEHPVLGCLSVELDHGEVRVVATDRYRLAARTLRADAGRGGPRSFLVEAERARELAVWALPLSEVTVEAGPEGVRLLGPEGERSVRVASGEFPDWRAVLAGLGPVRQRVVVDRAALRGPLVAAGERYVTLTAGPDGVAVDGVRVPRALCGGGRVRISFDPGVLLPAVDAGVGPDALLEVREVDGPVVVRSADQGSFTTCVMPVRVPGP
ncbi:MerR family transcriptional regulator [Streptomyces sp. NPDC005955]|jgi:DNA-binding transcriptional MerR regulator|uniref:DNA polymerase III subunit beta family protein n=1 Tax=Streptomyces sp. NPDC005955 TaxID=3364738 RepID=UPI0036AF03BE